MISRFSDFQLRLYAMSEMSEFAVFSHFESDFCYLMQLLTCKQALVIFGCLDKNKAPQIFIRRSSTEDIQ